MNSGPKNPIYIQNNSKLHFKFSDIKFFNNYRIAIALIYDENSTTLFNGLKKSTNKKNSRGINLTIEQSAISIQNIPIVHYYFNINLTVCSHSASFWDCYDIISPTIVIYGIFFKIIDEPKFECSQNKSYNKIIHVCDIYTHIKPNFRIYSTKMNLEFNVESFIVSKYKFRTKLFIKHKEDLNFTAKIEIYLMEKQKYTLYTQCILYPKNESNFLLFF